MSKAYQEGQAAYKQGNDPVNPYPCHPYDDSIDTNNHYDWHNGYWEAAYWDMECHVLNEGAKHGLR